MNKKQNFAIDKIADEIKSWKKIDSQESLDKSIVGTIKGISNALNLDESKGTNIDLEYNLSLLYNTIKKIN